MTDKRYWSKVVAKIIKAELAKRDLNYNELVLRLEKMGIEIKVDDLRGRISRGTFSATLFIQCLKAMGVKTLPLEESYFDEKIEE